MVRMCETHLSRGLPRPLAASAAILIVLSGCATIKPNAGTPLPTEELVPVLEKSGTYSRIARAIRVVARDQMELARIPIAEVPVDFKTQMVLIVGLGPMPTNEVGVRIARVWREGTRIRVQERRIYPGGEHAPGLELASPWTVVVVPRSDLNVQGFATQVPKGALGEHAGAR